jgi:hypothetical protein
VDARTGTTPSGPSAIDVSSRVFSLITKPLLTPSGSLVLAIGSAPVSFFISYCVSSICFFLAISIFSHFFSHCLFELLLLYMLGLRVY